MTEDLAELLGLRNDNDRKWRDFRGYL